VSFSPIKDSYNFIEIYKASVYDTIFCCIKGKHICDNNPTINHSMLFIWNLGCQMILKYIESLIIVPHWFIHYILDLLQLCNALWLGFRFLELFNIVCLTSANVLVCPIGVVVWYFMYHNNVWSLNVVSNYAILASSYWMFFTIHIVSQMNKRCFGSSFPAPWKKSILRVGSSPSIMFYMVFFPNNTNLLWLDILLPILWLLLLLLLLSLLPSLTKIDKAYDLTSFLGDTHRVMGST
jgi:hypothetical protein